MKRKFKATIAVATIVTMVSCNSMPVLATSIPEAVDNNDIALVAPVDTPTKESDKSTAEDNQRSSADSDTNMSEKGKKENSETTSQSSTEKSQSPISHEVKSESTPLVSNVYESTSAAKQYYRPEMSYSYCSESNGWQDSVSEGWISGVSDESGNIEGIKIDLSQGNGKIRYRTLSNDLGWTGWVTGGDMNGSHGNLIELLQIELEDELAENFDVYYRVNAKDTGWLDWVKNGEVAGMEDKSLPIVGYQVKLVDKSEPLQEVESKITSCNATSDCDTITMSAKIENPENVSRVRFVIWASAIGMNDAKWVDADYDENSGQWIATEPLDVHRFTTGEYQIRCDVDIINEDSISGNCTVDVPSRTMKATPLDNSNSVYQIIIDNAPSDVSVEFLTRTEDEIISRNKAVKVGKNKYHMYLDRNDYLKNHEGKNIVVQAYARKEDSDRSHQLDEITLTVFQ